VQKLHSAKKLPSLLDDEHDYPQSTCNVIRRKYQIPPPKLAPEIIVIFRSIRYLQTSWPLWNQWMFTTEHSRDSSSSSNSRAYW